MPKLKTTVDSIKTYWKRRPNIDYIHSSADSCWRCGWGTEKRLQRCHIVPRALGGPDKPENYVLLCAWCHSEAPNCIDSGVMWEWIEDTRNYFWCGCRYDCRSVLALFRKYNTSEIFNNIFPDELQVEKAVEDILYHKTSTHGFSPGGGRMLTDSTFQWVMEQAMKQLIERARAVTG